MPIFNYLDPQICQRVQVQIEYDLGQPYVQKIELKNVDVTAWFEPGGDKEYEIVTAWIAHCKAENDEQKIDARIAANG